jgi:hypothetical protein
MGVEGGTVGLVLVLVVAVTVVAAFTVPVARAVGVIPGVPAATVGVPAAWASVE